MRRPLLTLLPMGAALILVVLVAGCDSASDEAEPISVAFTQLPGYSVGRQWGTFVFRAQAEFDAETYAFRDARPVSLADSIVIAVSYGEQPANHQGGDVREIIRSGNEVTVFLNPHWQPDPVALADFDYQHFVLVAKADLPADADIVFEGDVPPQGP